MKWKEENQVFINMESTCYDGGDIAGTIFGTIIAIAALAALGYWLYKKKLNKKKGKCFASPFLKIVVCFENRTLGGALLVQIQKRQPKLIT